jgi:hypothetical protein
MIYFKTLYFPVTTAEAHAIEDRLGMPRYITLNGEALVVMRDQGMSLLMSLEQRGLIQIRNKLITGKMSKGFEMAIAGYLNKEAAADPLFGAKMKEHPEKDVKAVCDYILYEVSKQVSEGAGGFDDDEIFGMAHHFIDEDELKPQTFKGRVKVVTNHHVELSEEEKKDAKKAAIEEYKATVKKQERAEANERAKRAAEREKAKVEKKKQEAIEKAKKLEKMQPSLFGDEF